jgi:hypothetical protein
MSEPRTPFLAFLVEQTQSMEPDKFVGRVRDELRERGMDERDLALIGAKLELLMSGVEAGAVYFIGDENRTAALAKVLGVTPSELRKYYEQEEPRH